MVCHGIDKERCGALLLRGSLHYTSGPYGLVCGRRYVHNIFEIVVVAVIMVMRMIGF